MPFISITEKERREMLEAIGVKSFDELITNIPEKFVLKDELNLDPAMSEHEISKKIFELSRKNKSTLEIDSYLGAGVYDHFIPAAVDTIVSRPEFYTAYTPYQAEVSQGTLQYIFEYQTMICELTGMEIANASMYDGSTAVAEAILMAVRKTKKKKIVIAGTVHPNFRSVIKNYTEGNELEVHYSKEANGVTDIENLKSLVDDDCACVIAQSPNYYGNVEDMFAIGEITHGTKKGLFVSVNDPISLPILNSPKEYGADIVCGEGQALGNATYFGGPLFGYFATNLSLARMMPGRVVGETLDEAGNKAYALTLQAREQHIRRFKATSNICSNESLCTLAAVVYMSLMGKEGMKDVAAQSMTKAHYLAEEICKLEGFSLVNPDQLFFKEFVINTPIPAKELLSKCLNEGIFAGVVIDENQLMLAVTEKKSKSDLDRFVAVLAKEGR